jgi:hypothetical protein
MKDEHSAEKDAALTRELRLRLHSAEDMLKEAQRRVSDAEEALDAHLESCARPDVRSKAHSLNDCWCGMPHRRDDFL